MTGFVETPLFSHLKTCMRLTAGWSIAMIIVMSISDFCYPKPTHWHHFCLWWLLKKGGCQGVTGRTRFTCHWPELIIIMFSVVILIVLVILAKKIVRFQLSLVLKVLLVFSVSAISAREENDLRASDVIFSVIIQSILIILFSLGPPNSGVQDISVWAIGSTVYVSYRRLFKCPDLYCTPGSFEIKRHKAYAAPLRACSEARSSKKRASLALHSPLLALYISLSVAQRYVDAQAYSWNRERLCLRTWHWIVAWNWARTGWSFEHWPKNHTTL